MDDTNWIARSKENMQLILDDAREFYRANDSQINSSKSVLIVINSQDKSIKQEVQAGLNKEVVHRLEKKDFTRFLGVWIGSTNSKNNIVSRIIRETQNITSVLKCKKATEKQTLYILNRVLIPKIEYRIQHCHIPAKTCNKLTIDLRKIIKNKLGICSTLPNSAIHHKGIIKLKSIWEIQSESHITNLINRLNDTGPTGQATIIRLKQAQIENWEPINILTEEIPDTFNCKKNFTVSTFKRV